MSISSSTLNSLPKDYSPPNHVNSTAELRFLLENLTAVLQAPTQISYPSLVTVIDNLKNIQRHFHASNSYLKAKDDFRYLHGFQALLDTLRSFSGFYHPKKRSDEEKDQIFQLLEKIFAILTLTFQEHHGNQRYFSRRVEHGGWAVLEQTIASIGISGSESDPWSESRLLGLILSFALKDGRFTEICREVTELHQSASGVWSCAKKALEEMDGLNKFNDSSMIDFVGNRLSDILSDGTLLHFPDIIPTLIAFWKIVPRSDSNLSPVSIVIIKTLIKISLLSSYNLQKIHTTGILSTLLPLALDTNSPFGLCERHLIEYLCTIIISLGVNSLNDAEYLICSKSSAATNFLAQAIKSSPMPPCIQFDLSLHGYASIELPTLGRNFPPMNTPGYTFVAWIYVDRFDPKSHTTLFCIFDSSQTCFVLMYLEKDTRNFILQTSITSTRPSVRFKSTIFTEKRWYHVAIVQKKPRSISSSIALLYIDGEFVEQVKCQYPAPPPFSNTSTESFASFASSSTKSIPVQAFLGTPKDLSLYLGTGVIFSRWSLASAHLVEDVLSNDLIAVYYRLGPRYKGNFQDCLGSFQTYEASAALGICNEPFYPRNDNKLEILGAIREKAGTLLPESRIILSILPNATTGTDRTPTYESNFPRWLDKIISTNLINLTQNNSYRIAINAAVPCIRDALACTHGSATLTGDPVVMVPRSLDDAIWQLGGFVPIVLKLIESSGSQHEIIRAVEILFGGVKGSWRNSEAMERENGYAILAALIRGNIGAGTVISSKYSPDVLNLKKEERDELGFRLLSLILSFVGYNSQKPEDSYIVNPLAYRVFLVDFDMWRKSALKTQMLYYKQFIIFGEKSKFHQFNSRRLFRMRVVKKFLDALKAETCSRDTFPSFLEALTSLVKCNLSAEVFRSLALFITYALHKPSGTSIRNPRNTPRTSSASCICPIRPVISTHGEFKDPQTNTLSKRLCGIRVLEMYSNILCEKGNTSIIRKFARTVTNKWLLYLLSEDDPDVVIYGTKILVRLIVIHGSGYISKFATKTGGFIIMRHQLKRWWTLPTLWLLCLSILFNKDIAEIDLERSIELFSLLENFSSCKVVNSQVLPVITSMLQCGMNVILRNVDDPDSPSTNFENEKNSDNSILDVPALATCRRRSMPLTKELGFQRVGQSRKEILSSQATILHSIIRFFADLHSKSPEFQEFALSSEYVRLLLGVLFPIIVSTDAISADIELNSRESALAFEGNDVIIRTVPRLSNHPMLKIRTTPVKTQPSHETNSSRAKTLRGFSFVLSSNQSSELSPSSAKFTLVPSPRKIIASQKMSNSLVEGLLELVIGVFIDRVMVRKEFPGFGLFSKTPPGFKQHQVYFRTFVLRNTISQLGNNIQLDQKSLWEPKVIQNMARFVAHICDAVFEGWFLSGAEPLIDFAGTILEYLHRPEISKIKNVRLCHQAIITIKGVFFRVVLLRLSELDSGHVSESEAVAFMDRIFYWQGVLLSPDHSQEDFFALVCYQLYLKLIDYREPIKLAAANLWRIILVQKPEETSRIFQNFSLPEHRRLITGFKKLIELENEVFVKWVGDQRKELDEIFSGAMSKTWEKFVDFENDKTEETNRARISRRKEKLKQWNFEQLNEEDTLLRHDLAATTWMKNIYASEHLKHQRAQQDQQDNFAHLVSVFSNMDREVHRPCSIFHNNSAVKWKLDRTEGRNRMRLRMLPDRASPTYDYRPKRRSTQSSLNQFQSDSKVPAQISASSNFAVSSSGSSSVSNLNVNSEATECLVQVKPENFDNQSENVVPEDDFELVGDPNDPGEDDCYEDKNRKVMRSLQRGDQVQHVFNISRITGLEACEGLSIIGKDCLYLIDNVFQCSDGEIVNVSQAPKDERDPYLQMISGNKEPKHNVDEKPQNLRVDQFARSWKWNDLISIFKRRFLFRDVALEVFFTDGRNYLLTAISPTLRDDLFSKITSKAPHTCGSACLPNPEDGWRLEALRVSEEASTSLTSKFGNIFNSSSWNPAMRKWAKGEMSNFHYLMLVNTMAGRTFNDLTQYPVFPWVLSDYTSSELDLNDPSSFRDLSKPMGAQNNSRAAEFVERYKQFAEMGDQNTPAFHYGTHYSSAMIVTSYLIRLQPFVQSYLLLQGGNFDHPDRLFYSIKEAWLSASRDNMTDVRELTPEFFYLPEFLTNNNCFDFGQRQGKGGAIDTVELPPWALGDPKIFIAKNREALESPYVSRHLHQWIDLIFGSKQRGDAAIDSINLFHYLSYHGAKDLESISDPMQKLATIGIIHNFGQTPHQVFTKPHQSREDIRCKPRRLDTCAQSLKRLPFPLFEFNDRITSIVYLPKLDRLLCSTTFRIYIPPHFDKYLEFGFADGSIRFFFIDSRKPAGLFENLHQGQISTAILASSSLLITAGEDCVISTHNISTSLGKTIDLQSRTSLFAHRTPVTVLAASRSFSTLLSSSIDGVVILWDLNSFEFVRQITTGRGSVNCACINDVNGDIMICGGQIVTLLTLNGELILEQNISVDQDDVISSCAWYEGIGNEWIENELCFTGHRGGVVSCWKKTISRRNSKWGLELINRMHNCSGRNECGETAVGSLAAPINGRSRSCSSFSGDTEGSITCIRPMANCVYTGDENGKVYEWNIVKHER